MTNIKALQKFVVTFVFVFLASQVQAKPIIVNETFKEILNELDIKNLEAKCNFFDKGEPKVKGCNKKLDRNYEILKNAGYNIFYYNDYDDEFFENYRYYSVGLGLRLEENSSFSFIKKITNLKDEEKVYTYKKLTPGMEVPKYTIIGMPEIKNNKVSFNRIGILISTDNEGVTILEYINVLFVKKLNFENNSGYLNINNAYNYYILEQN